MKIKYACILFSFTDGPDSVSITPVESTLTEGVVLDSTNIVCQELGNCIPSCKIKWTGPKGFSKEEVTNSLKLFTGSNQLLRTQSGTYICTVTNTNTSSEITKQTTVHIQCKYVFLGSVLVVVSAFTLQTYPD